MFRTACDLDDQVLSPYKMVSDLTEIGRNRMTSVSIEK
jgi:hypothetical protein